MSNNSFNTLTEMTVADKTFHYYSLAQLQAESHFPVQALPFCLKILLENLLRNEDGVNVTKDDIHALANLKSTSVTDVVDQQIAFSPARVVLQDFTGVPALVDLAAMRDAMAKLDADPQKINPLVPVDLVIDHSVMVDYYASPDALRKNTEREFERNLERYNFLRWGQKAFSNFRVVPPGTGIVHQVNLEYLGHGVMTKQEVLPGVNNSVEIAYPDTLVGTDSHTTMINGLGVLGWGVGGIEAEAAMLGQPITMLIPRVVGFELTGDLPAGATATDLVLMVTQMLRKHGVVGKFVEFFGSGLDSLSLADRATIANMAPEYGATIGIFPIDDKTMEYMRLTGRSESHCKLVEDYAKAQGLWRQRGDESKEIQYDETLYLNLAEVEPSIAGPKRPQDRIALREAKSSFQHFLASRKNAPELIVPASAEANFDAEGGNIDPELEELTKEKTVHVSMNGESFDLQDGAVVIAAITSCTNTSNPAVMLAAGLLAQNAHRRGLKTKPWVKTSLAPGSQVVPTYLKQAGLDTSLNALGFNLVGFGCTTCIGNSGPLEEEIHTSIKEYDLTVAAVLSGNRNFEGRIHADVKANYLASPPLVVAYALAGTMNIDLSQEPLGVGEDGQPIFLQDLWPSQKEVDDAIQKCIKGDLFQEKYADVFQGTAQWQKLPVPEETTYSWPESSYIKHPPFFQGMGSTPQPLKKITDARCLVKVGDSITTDHISPAGAIHPDSPAGQYLQKHDVQTRDFNSLGSRRGNHEVMMRGTFANVRLRNELAPDRVGGYTRYLPDNSELSIFDAAMRYQQDGTPLVVIAGKEYGTGSSRDWAAKGTKLLGVTAVIAESFERIHRSNLVGFGVLPLQFKAGESASSLGLTGEEAFSFEAIPEQSAKELQVSAKNVEGGTITFLVDVRIDTETEWDYYINDGILHSVLRKLAS
ncbi:Aconitate hydratase A [Thalassocella blandensis]|nr:Aconitate hydratase A [Thalassocella blandensis]